MSKQAERIAGLSPEKRELLLRRLALRGGGARRRVEPRERVGDTCPVSFAQQRLWFIEQLEPGTAAYHSFVSLRLEGALDAAALAASVNDIVRRHEVLHTTFKSVNETPVQVIAPALEVSVPVVDVSGLPEAEARRLAEEEAARPFDLSAGPLLRACLLKLGAQEHVLLLTMHHIVTDGWSMGLFLDEMAALYEGRVKNMAARLPELSVQYADYAVWQREWLEDGALERQLDYWRQKLAGTPPSIELPADRPRANATSERGAVQSLALPAALTEQLKALSLAEGVTLFVTLLTAFKVLLSRYTSQTDIAVGTPIAGRTRAELEPLIGFFVNTLVLRTDLGGGPSFRQLLGRVKEVTLGAFEHQEVPFERVVEELQPERELSRNPLFQVMFALQTGLMNPAPLHGLKVSFFETDSTVAQFDLSLDIYEDEGRLVCSAEYKTELFDADTVTRLLEHYRALLEDAARDPAKRVRELSLLTPEERRRLTVEWNDTARSIPRGRCVHELFEERAALTPQAVAVVCGEERLSYGELNARANRLARHLRSVGVGPESRVGVLLGRGAEAGVALLGVVKAGGAWVALDASYPRERLQLMLDDAGVEAVITERRFVEAFELRRARLVCLDADGPQIERHGGENLEKWAAPENLAYVVYTSGTTGRPKGILVEHRSLVNSIYAFIERHGVTAGDRLLQFASLSFDVAAEEFFAAWLSGARAVMRPAQLSASHEEFGGFLKREGVTLANLPASFWAEWLTDLAERGGCAPKSLRRVVVGNEKTLSETLDKWRSLVGAEVAWCNAYGPSETTITASNYEPPSAADGGEVPHTRTSSVPIGRPVINAQMYVLDGALQLVPVGVAGELYVGGAGVARGYHNGPAQTAERFIPDPFGGAPGARLYRTGDLARRLADGQIEFLGRADEQIKVRGFRVELSEVEAALKSYTAVRECVVVGREDAPGKVRLVAYVVASQGGSATAGELRRHLQERLPEYMIPSTFVALDALPLLPSGKVDRRHLPAPDSTGVEIPPGSVAPRTPLEEVLAGIWRDVLGVRAVGAHDNFFDLGGHSLLATRVISRVCAACGVKIPLRALFESPTIAGLARHVEGALKAGRGLESPPVRRVPRGKPLPLSFAQRRLWFLHRLDPDTSAYNMPDAIRLIGALDISALERALGEVVRRHEALRTTFVVYEGELAQLIHEAEPLKLGVVDLTTLPEAEREARRLAEEEAARPFDLSAGPLLRARLLRLSASEHVLLLNTHHIVSDGWSFGVLSHELTTLYSAYSAGRESPLAELPIQYADYAAWQREWLQGGALESQLDYWRGELSGLPPLLQLPTDRPRPAVQTYRGAFEPVEISRDVAERLKMVARGEGATLFMALLAAFNALLQRYTNQADIAVGMPVANRNREETEGLIGFFVNTLVLRTDLSGDPTFRVLLSRVREKSLGAFVHQDVPFEKLVEELEPERSLSHTPLFQAMFTMQNTPAEELRLEELRLSEMDVELHEAKYDLSLSLGEDEDGLSGYLSYSTDLFEAATVRRMLSHFARLLEAAARDPDTHLSELPLMSEEEYQQVLAEWNDTRRDYPRDACVHELFERQAARRPDAAAVVFDGGQLTYSELNERADQLARRLRRAGVGPESVVGVMLERSAELVVSLLAVLKAGGAYVLLDLSYPKERLRVMLEDARVRLLLARERLLDALPEYNGEILCLEDDRHHHVANEATANPPRGVSPEHLAYIFYTSGSTGRPKGVLATHAGAVNYLTFIRQAYELSEQDVVLQAASLSFDASVRDILGPLAAGARLVLVGDADARDPSALLSAVRRERVTCLLSVVPTMLNALTEAAGARNDSYRSLRLVLSSGETLPLSDCRRAREVFGAQLAIVNQYGATECTMSQTYQRVDFGERGRGTVPAGHPIHNSEVYVLDKRLGPQPVGIAGEVYIGGAGVARGYHDGPALTAERFIPHPFGGEPGARLYRTGDLARFLPDGRLELLGRMDQQVKIRGMRVELAEVEAVLGEHGNVRDAAVIDREAAPGDKYLAAYVVLRRPSATAADELREALKEKLPAHMLPAAFVALDALPLLPNGKVDRGALPAPAVRGTARRRPYVAPRTPTERALAEMWAEVLRVDKVGVDDDFFDLGGHSLLAMQVVSRLRNTFRTEPPLRALLERPTVAGLADYIDSAERSAGAADAEKIAQILERIDRLSAEETRTLLEEAGL